MKKVLICAFALAIGLMLVAPAMAVAEPKKGKPTFVEEKGSGDGGQGGQSDKWILSNDAISVWFHEKKPMLKVFSTGEDGNKSGYMLKLERLYETDASGAERAHINLNAASLGWIATSEDEADGLALTLEGNVASQGSAGGAATVKFVFHINLNSSEVKFDVIVENWVWISEDPANATLSLEMLTVSDVATRNAENQASIGGKGYMRWEKNAERTHNNGTTGALKVEAKIEEEGKGSHITLTFNGTGGYQTLSYDPTIGVYGTNWNLIAGVIVLAAAGAAAVAIYAVNRKKVK